jgi:YfiH family protein
MRHNYIKPNWPAPKHVVAYTTTRLCGNLANHVGDDADSVRQNREKLMQDLNLPAMPSWLNQVHSPTAISLDTPTATIPTADAAYTHVRKRICTVLTADCLPLLVTNRDGTVVAAIHAGWRGLLAGVIDNTIAALNAPPDTLLIWLGPAIGPRVFEVGDEVRQAYIGRDARYQAAFTPHRDRWLANLYQLATITLDHLGVNVSQVYGGDFCTYQQPDLFYSYRRDQGRTGRMATLIYMM